MISYFPLLFTFMLSYRLTLSWPPAPYITILPMQLLEIKWLRAFPQIPLDLSFSLSHCPLSQICI